MNTSGTLRIDLLRCGKDNIKKAGKKRVFKLSLIPFLKNLFIKPLDLILSSLRDIKMLI